VAGKRARIQSVPKGWQPIRKRVWSESSDPHFTGPIVVEFTKDGIRWWWDGAESGEPEGVVTWEDVVANNFLQAKEDVKQDIASARRFLDAADKAITRLRAATSFRVVD
jgi:hypothetical protein